MMDSELALSSWADKRRGGRRRPLRGERLLAQADNEGRQGIGFIEADRKAGKRITGDEYAVLVTHLEHEVLTPGPLSRDRADAENAFDELKNQGAGAVSPLMIGIVVSSRRGRWR
jgi:hypothetical protein